MSRAVVVVNNFVRCTNCNHKVRLIQHKACGAVYARKWKSLNVQRCEFLKMWVESSFYNSYVTKNMLHKKLLPSIKRQKLKGFVKPLNFAARVSELVSAGTNYKNACVQKETGITSTEGDAIRGPFYKLDARRVKSVLKKGGKLT